MTEEFFSARRAMHHVGYLINALEAANASAPHNALHELVGMFKQPIRLSEQVIEIAARGGYTLLGEDERSADTLVREVEIAFSTRPSS